MSMHKILLLILIPLHSFGKFRVHPLREGQTIFDVAVIILVIFIVGFLYNRIKKNKSR
jgi:hypothetical protein